MTGFWEDESRLEILRKCLSTIIRETCDCFEEPTRRSPACIVVFLAMIRRNRSVGLQVYEGDRYHKLFELRMRHSEIPQRTDAETWASKHHTLSLAYVLSPVKSSVADLVDLLLRNNVKFQRLTIKLRRQRHRPLNRLLGKHNPQKRQPPHTVQDDKGRTWSHTLQLDNAPKMDVFEKYVDWLENGSYGTPPDGEWNGEYLSGDRISL